MVVRPSVVDAHVHIFPPELAASRDAHLRRDLWFEHLYANPKARIATAEDLLASMERAEVGQSVACGFPWRDPALCHQHNDYLAESAAAYPGRIAWLATVNPTDPSAAAEAERCFTLGASGIGELNADAQGFDFREPAALGALVEVCEAWERPILFHVSEPLGHIYPGKGTATPERFVTFLAAYPSLSVVAAHGGGGLPFYELMPEIATVTQRVVYDSAASTLLYDMRIVRAVLDVVGVDRVLMATDFPVLRQDRFLRRLQDAGLRDEELGPVLGGNAARVFHLHGQEGSGS